jgi:hypothetical protein
MEATTETIPEAQTPEIFVAKVENSALLDAPVYESHSRGKNWLAVITCDPTSPGGYARKFCKAGRGVYYYIVDQSIVGRAVEFGGDYYSGSGHKHVNRFYGIVISLTDTEIRVQKYDTGRQACKVAEVNKGPGREVLIAERELILSRLAEINLVLGDDDNE